MWSYSEKVKDHFFHPRNAHVVDNASAVGDVGSLSCDDVLCLMLRVDPQTEVIEEVDFQTPGCGSAIASSSVPTELIIGRTLIEAGQITNQQTADYLDDLPSEKTHYSVMGQETLYAAIAHFRGKNLEEEHKEGRLICKCFGVDEGYIRRAVVNNGLTTLKEVINYIKAGGSCIARHEKIELVLAAILTQQSSAPLPAEAAHDAHWQSVADIINELYPYIQTDGGDMTLLNVIPRQVTVGLSGSCSGCMMTGMTLAWLQRKLIERTGTYMDVVAAPITANQPRGGTTKPVYLGNNATTHLNPMVLDAMMPSLTNLYGNPSLIHDFSLPAQAALERAYQQAAALFRADYPSEIIFTSCVTEATVTAIVSAVASIPERREIITSAVEYFATLAVREQLERQGYLIHRIAVDQQGALDMAQFRAALSPRVALVNIIWANNETGVMFSMPELAKLAYEQGALFHCDTVQVVGKAPMTFGQTRIDMLSCLAYEFHGPKGVGYLWLRRGTRFRPSLRGGHQAYGRRVGTENISDIVGMGTASELAQVHLPDIAWISQLCDRPEQHLQVTIPVATVMGGSQPRVPGTLNLASECIEGEAILPLMNWAGITASSGSACTSGSLEPPHVIRAMNIPYTAAHGTIHFPLPCYTREKEIDHVIVTLPSAIDRLRALSPYQRQGQSHLQGGVLTPVHG